MSIGNIKSDGGISPLNEQQLHQAAQKVKTEVATEQKTVGGDRVEISEQAKLFQEVSKWKGELENAPEPNAGRLNEIKAAVENGTYINDKVMKETAQVISNQLFS